MKYLILLFTIAVSITGAAQVKVGDNPTDINPSSALEIESANKGFLPPRMNTTQRDAIVAPAAGLMIFNTTTNRINYFTGVAWYEMAAQNIVPNATVNGPNGTTLTFMSHNLGADYSLNPLIPAQAIHGNYYQYGRLTSAATAYTPPEAIAGWNSAGGGTTNAWGAVKTANDPCPAEFRVPTYTELGNMASSGSGNTFSAIGTWAASPTNFTAGVYVKTSGVEKMFLPATGLRLSGNGSLVDRGLWGYYRTTTPGLSFAISQTFHEIVVLGEHFGASVRCIKQ